MADKMFELQQWGYHLQSNGDRAVTQQLDEMAISNMLRVLENPAFREILSPDEVRVILDTVKNHVVFKAKMIGEIQNEKIAGMNRGRGL